MRRPLVALVAVVLGLAAVVGVANAALDAGPQSVEARTQAVAATLRCPTCQNLSVADSPSDMARSMRTTIAEQLDQGHNPDAVRQWFVDRYGPWVLLTPPREGVSLLVWLTPVAALAVAGAVGGWLLRGRRRHRPRAGTHVDADGLLDSWRAGELTVPDTPAGERLAAALQWLDEDRHTTRADSPRLAAAADEVAAAWHTLAQPTGERASDRRPLGWAAGALVLLTAIAAALPTAIAARGIGGVATGGTPGTDPSSILAEQEGGGAEPLAGADAAQPPAGSREEVAAWLADLDEVAAGEADPARAAEAVTDRLPADVSPSDRLTVGLMALQHNRLAAADALAISVLQADADTGRLEATLLRGLALTAQGDDAGPDWLQRFIDAAPPDHPGRPVADKALTAAESQP